MNLIKSGSDNLFAPLDISGAREGGVTRRVVFLCLGLAVFFGYIIPVIDLKLQNTYLGAQHLPSGAVERF